MATLNMVDTATPVETLDFPALMTGNDWEKSSFFVQDVAETSPRSALESRNAHDYAVALLHAVHTPRENWVQFGTQAFMATPSMLRSPSSPAIDRNSTGGLGISHTLSDFPWTHELSMAHVSLADLLHATNTPREISDMSQRVTWYSHMIPSSPILTSDRNSRDSRRHIPDSLLKWQLSRTNKYEDFVGILRLRGLDAAADRLSYLQRATESEPGEPSIQIGSMRCLAQFLITERLLHPPRIGVNPSGLLQVEWRPEAGGILAMWFLQDGNIQFAAAAEEVRPGSERERVSGVLPKDEMMEAVRPLIKRMALSER